MFGFLFILSTLLFLKVKHMIRVIVNIVGKIESMLITHFKILSKMDIYDVFKNKLKYRTYVIEY